MVSDELHAFRIRNVSDDDNVFCNYGRVNCSINMYLDSGSSLDTNFDSFPYTDYSTCN